MSLRQLRTTVLRVLGEWATPATPGNPGALWRVVDDGRGFPVLQTRIHWRDRWVDADPLKEAAAVWDGLSRVLTTVRDLSTDSAPKVRETRRPKQVEQGPAVGEKVFDIDEEEFEVREVRTQGPVPVVFGLRVVDGSATRFRSVVLTPEMRDYLLTHTDWRKGHGLPLASVTVAALRQRLGTTLSGLVSAKWERATSLGGTRTEVAERVGGSISAASERADDTRRAAPVPRSPEADALLLAAKDDEALERLAAAWRSSIKSMRQRRAELRRQAGMPSNRGRRSGPARVLLAFGETKTLREWSNDPRCKTTQSTLRARILSGWNTETAIVTETGAPPRLSERTSKSKAFGKAE